MAEELELLRRITPEEEYTAALAIHRAGGVRGLDEENGFLRYAVDGNLDGEMDPQQIDDAVLTAAVYLCDSSEDLTVDDEWVRAVTTYNQSMAYARDVAARATSFEDLNS